MDITAAVRNTATGVSTANTHYCSSNPISFPSGGISFDFRPAPALIESHGSFDRESEPHSAWTGEVIPDDAGVPRGWVSVCYVWPIVDAAREWTHEFDFFERTVTLTFRERGVAAAKPSATIDGEGDQAAASE